MPTSHNISLHFSQNVRCKLGTNVSVYYTILVELVKYGSAYVRLHQLRCDVIHTYA